MVPIVSTLTPLTDGVRTLVPADAVRGISAARASGTPLSSLNIGDAKRWLFGIAGGFIDHGPHSFDMSISQSVENESYNDKSTATMRAIGGEARYWYNRTYGVQFQWSTYEKYSYTDALGVIHDIPLNPSWTLFLERTLAMNYQFFLTYGNTQLAVLDQTYRAGKSWGLSMQYLW